MRRTGRVFFIMFYVAATIGVARERSVFVADRVQQSVLREDDRFQAPRRQLPNVLPHFSHAQKQRPNNLIGSAPAQFWAPPSPAVHDSEDPPQFESFPQRAWDVFGARSPPARALHDRAGRP